MMAMVMAEAMLLISGALVGIGLFLGAVAAVAYFLGIGDE
jgi:hypothetical protein